MKKPIVLITMGDPAGIGPEIAVRALADKSIYDVCKPVVIGDKNIIFDAARLSGLSLKINALKDIQYCLNEHGTIDLIDLENVNTDSFEYGKISANGGRVSYEYIKKAVELINENKADAVATAPINKKALQMAGVNFIGHTEILSGLTKTKDPLTMFEVENLRVFFLSRHVSLRKAIDLVVEKRVYEYILKCSKAMELLGMENEKMAVAGLNPHNGDDGLFGSEEIEVIGAVKRARAEGIDVEGPIPADSVFALARKGRYGSVLSLYHDQGHIATKTLDFDRTVSITVGLPFIRTSVDHGTAMDIAGLGIANETGMVEAIKKAAFYAGIYNK